MDKILRFISLSQLVVIAKHDWNRDRDRDRDCNVSENKTNKKKLFLSDES